MKENYKEVSEEIQFIIDMFEILNVLDCLKCSEIGTYDCYVEVPGTKICCDKCIATEIRILNEIGIKTIGCCCGHGKEKGYIQVAPEYCEKMKEIGYIQQPIDEYGNGQWCFEPKSVLLNH